MTKHRPGRSNPPKTEFFEPFVPIRLCSAGCLALATLSLAASEPLLWRWSNPRPHGNNIVSMAETNGWFVQVGEAGQIYVSANLDQWIPRESGTTKALRSVVFFGAKTVISGENGTVLVSDARNLLSEFRAIDLGTADWLEGIASSPDLLVAVGDNGAIYTSGDAEAWQRQPQPFTDWLRGIAFGNGMFAAVGEGGVIITSTDGVNWQRQNSGVSEHLNSVTWAQDRFLAVGDSGPALASPDGRSWQPLNTGAANPLLTVTANAATRLVAGETEVRLEENGVWSDEIRSPEQSFPAPAWTYLSTLWDGSLFLLGGRSGMLVEGFRTNSASATIWVDRYESLRNWLWDVVPISDLYLAVGDRASVMTSDDGIEWNLELVPNSLTNAIFLGAGGTTNLLVAVGNQGSAMTSTNGVVWEAVTVPTDNDLQGVAVLDDLFVITGGGGTILTSRDGRNWAAQASPTTSFLSGVAAFPGGLVSVGNEGAILHSIDGMNWTLQPSGATNWIYKVRYLDDRLIAVGQTGILLTSFDGTRWTRQSSGTDRWLTDVAKIGERYFVSGTQGTVLESTNSIEWTEIGTITRKSLFGLASRGGQIVAVGTEGVILRSQVVPDTEPIEIVRLSRASNQNLFLFSGHADQRFTLDRSSDLREWVPGAKLEFLEGATTLIYLEGSANAPAQEFYRASPR